MLYRILIVALLPLVAYAQEPDGDLWVWLRDGGLHTRRTISNIVPGQPPQITSPGHNLSKGARIWCHDVYGLPSVNGQKLVLDATADTFSIAELDGTPVDAPGKLTDWYAGGSCGIVRRVRLLPSPRLLLDGPDGELTKDLMDPDGDGPRVAPKLERNPEWSLWKKMQARAAGCTGASCPSTPADKVAGYAPLYHAMLWFSDNSRTQSKLDAVNWLVNTDKTFSVSPSYPWPAGCADTLAGCGMAGEWLDSRSWIWYFNGYAYDLMRTVIDPDSRRAIAAKILKGVMGEPCENGLAQQPGTLTFSTTSAAVFGEGTAFDGGLVGMRIALRASAASWQWRYVRSVESPTQLTLTASPTISGSAAAWHRETPWNESKCGLMWTAAHHDYTPAWYIGKRYAVLAAPITSATQTTIKLASAAAIGKRAPYYIRIVNEVMKVVAVNGDELTVERGAMLTAPVASVKTATGVYSSDVMYSGGGATSTLADGRQKARLSVMDDHAHNLTWAHTWGMIIAALSLASDSETARLAFEEGWNVFYDYYYPWMKDMSGWIQSGGTASYISRLTGFTADLAIVMKHATGGEIDITEGNWLVRQALNYGPMMKPWDLAAHFPYTDSASILDRWARDEYGPALALAYLFPRDEYVGWMNWHLNKESKPTPMEAFNEQTFAKLWAWTPAAMNCPSGPDDPAKCTDYRTVALPHVFHVKSDYDPPTPPAVAKPISAYANPDNGWYAGLSMSSWKPDASGVWFLGLGLTKDHLAGYSTCYEYMAFCNAMLLAGGGAAACGPCAGAYEQDQTAVGVVTDVRRGFANPEDSTTGVNAIGSRGINCQVDRIKATDTLSYWRADGKNSYRSQFGVKRGYRHFVHLKSGQQPYLLVVDDYDTTAPVKLGLTLPYRRVDVSKSMLSSGGASVYRRAGADVEFTPVSNARMNTRILLAPSDVGYAESDYTFTATGGTGIVRRLAVNQQTATVGPRAFAALHQISPSTAIVMPETSVKSVAGFHQFTIQDALPRVVLVPENSDAPMKAASFTLEGAPAGAHVVGVGFKPGTYSVAKDSVSLAADRLVGTDGVLEIRTSTTERADGSYAITAQPLAVGPVAASVACIVGARCDVDVRIAGGLPPYTASTVGQLPEGIRLDPVSGKLGGMATATGEFPISISISDSDGALASLPFTLRIEPPPALNLLIVSPPSQPDTACIRQGDTAFDENFLYLCVNRANALRWVKIPLTVF